MIVKSAINGSAGFDVNQQLTGAQYSDFKDSGYGFAIRYIPRTPALIKGNLTSDEIQAVLGAGLALSVVQHVSNDGWEPSASLGTQYGQFGSDYAEQIGLPKGMNIWLDLEGVSSGSISKDVIAYCQSWYAAMNAAGYVPGIYCGWNCGLTPGQLYSDLSFRHYWKAYNFDGDIPTRGWQIVQHPQQTFNGVPFDRDTVQTDDIGDLPLFLFP